MYEANSIFQWHREGYEDLNAYWDTLDQLETAVRDFSDAGLGFVEDQLDDVLAKIDAFEPTVSVIGQVKAGKSTLLNALIGQSDLLPSDVNPWTSVITALHMNSRHRPHDTRALFRFFDREEWDRLVATGGRLGEMANRAGFESEAEEVRTQVTAMRAATEARLGDEFDQLLGGSRAYPALEKSIIDRYICYGDPDEMAEGSDEGVYADLTKSADLYIDLPHLPRGLCLRDTPGVNDTFMMREQITLNAIGDSRACIVVLSAHQALTTMDLALLRIICAIDAREVLIFVNRIDELEDPVGAQTAIGASIRKTLGRMGLGEEIEILFGSGYWAQCALGDVTRMAPASRKALAKLNGGKDANDLNELRQRAMAASGLQPLLKAVVKRIVEGPGQAMLNDVHAELNTIISMAETVETVARASDSGPVLSEGELRLRLAELEEDVLKGFDSRAAEQRAELRARLERAQGSFVASALEALQSHIDTFGEIGAWTHDPTALRMAMKTAFTSATTKLRRHGETAFDEMAEGIDALLAAEFGVAREPGTVAFPEQPVHRAPTVLARMISLDMQGAWWRKYWRFNRKKAAETRYREVIMAETTPLIDDLIIGFFDPAIARSREIIEGFALDQGKFCDAVRARCLRGSDEAHEERLSA
ncbi:dynamin family protein [Thioclava pacifica]|uniref:Dynamin N-terminal domain-containing protein n=1 Tax=Thioclava pacifica DSM 10166 TaxID=1353537 RepID=A0A074JLC1_9RHOB|nr:dynamin family protein [Thioclava pacifica]KEO56398.1 hypothetical protein TP2_02390 [Thioclava pacifica DSM 10166]